MEKQLEMELIFAALLQLLVSQKLLLQKLVGDDVKDQIKETDKFIEHMKTWHQDNVTIEVG